MSNWAPLSQQDQDTELSLRGPSLSVEEEDDGDASDDLESRIDQRPSSSPSKSSSKSIIVTLLICNVIVTLISILFQLFYSSKNLSNFVSPPDLLSPSPTVCIFQFDSRAVILPNYDGPEPEVWMPMGANDERLPYWSMSSVANFAYALHHNYDYLNLQSDTDDCIHETNGKLMPQWCKVKAMEIIQRQRPDADYYIFLDSDSYFHNHEMTLFEMLEKAEKINPRTQNSTLIVSSEPFVECTMPSRKPRRLRSDECQANSGVIIWRHYGEHVLKMKEIIEYWWSLTAEKTEPGHFRHEWGFEQSVLSRWVRAKYPNEFAIVPYSEKFSIFTEEEFAHIQPITRPLFNTPLGDYIGHFWSSPTGWPQRIPILSARLKWLIQHKFWTHELSSRCHNHFEIECQLIRQPWPSSDLNELDDYQIVVITLRNVLPFLPALLLEDNLSKEYNLPLARFLRNV